MAVNTRTLQYHMNRKAGTLVNDVPTRDAQAAANVWAGTTNMDMVGALNVKAGNVVLRSTNMVTANPSFETNASGWSQIAAGGILTRDTTQFRFGVASGKQVNDGTVGSQGPFTLPASPASPLTAYTGSVYLKGNVGGETVTFNLSRMPGSAGFASLPVTLTTGWQRFTVTGTTPSGTTDVYLAIYEPAIKAQTFFLDGAMIEPGSTVSPYSDATSAAYKELAGVLNQLAGTTGLEVDGAAASIP